MQMSLPPTRDPEKTAWARYLSVCRGAKKAGSYDEVEPHAWLRLQRDLLTIHRERGTR